MIIPGINAKYEVSEIRTDLIIVRKLLIICSNRNVFYEQFKYYTVSRS